MEMSEKMGVCMVSITQSLKKLIDCGIVKKRFADLVLNVGLDYELKKKND